MMSNFNILFTSAGRRVSLVREFKRALTDLSLEGNIIAADTKNTAPASFVADRSAQVPLCHEPAYIDILKNICIQHQVNLLIPLIDPELRILAKHRSEFDDIGTTVLVSSVETNEICLDKRKTNQFFNENGIPTPKLFNDEQVMNLDTEYPLLIKPADGSGSTGVTKTETLKELEFFKDYIPNAIIQEFVQGQEYTLDVLVDFEGEVQCIVPRLRLETRAGEISKGLTVKNCNLMNTTKKVVDSLPGVLGCITVQCFITPDSNIKFTEINPRFGGGIPLSIQAGADFPRWIIEMMLGKNPVIKIDDWQDGVMMLRYDDAIFLNKDMIQ